MTAYFAAFLIVAAVAMFVAAPLTEGFLRRKRSVNLELTRLQHDRELALQGLRELEFDHEMGKLDEVDYVSLKANLESHAFAAMRLLEQLAQVARPVRPLGIRPHREQSRPGFDRLAALQLLPPMRYAGYSRLPLLPGLRDGFGRASAKPRAGAVNPAGPEQEWIRR